MRTSRVTISAAVAALLASVVAVLPDASAAAAPSTRDSGAPSARRARARIPPDPPPLSSRRQWLYDLRWDSGEIYLLAVRERDMGAPRVTPRAMGRFALELFEGPTLIERVRFDFPMLGGPPPRDAGYFSPPRLDRKLKTRIGVLFPATPRGTRLELWDRALDRRWALPWPPARASGPRDAGPDRTGASHVPSE